VVRGNEEENEKFRNRRKKNRRKGEGEDPGVKKEKVILPPFLTG